MNHGPTAEPADPKARDTHAPAGATAEDALLLLDAANEPAVLAALRGAYRGRHGVLDALWWRAHPQLPSPSGARDPAVERDSLARRAYSREARPTDPVDLASADEELVTDAARLDEAIAAMRRAASRMAAGDTGHAGRTGPPGATGRIRHTGGSGRPGHTGAERSMALPHRRIALAGAAVLVVIAAGLAVSAANGSLPVGATTRTDVTAGDRAPDELARDRAVGDVPDAALPDGYDLATVRRLLPANDVDGADAVGDYDLFGARTVDDAVCLVLAFADGGIASSCVSEAEFGSRGVGVTTNVYRQSRASLGTLVLVPHTVTWSQDGIGFASVSPDREP